MGLNDEAGRRVLGSATVRVDRRCAERLRGGHAWVYRNEIEAVEGELQPGAVVAVSDGRGLALGAALYSSASKIALRLISRPVSLEGSRATAMTREAYVAEVGQRVRAAIVRRKVIAPIDGLRTGEATNAQRLVFSEADELPGMVIDRYGDIVIVQLLTQGTAQDDVRAAIAAALADEFAGAGFTVWERPDARMRELEELPLPPERPMLCTGQPKQATEFLLNGLRFGFDAGSGQKTGAFLDQRLNYAAAAHAVAASGLTGNALDVCTYQGGFALHLARVCARVTGVDASRAALEVADANLLRNSDLRGETDWIEADAFELLRALDDAARTDDSARYDAVVLDPPAFAKSRRAAEGALRGYKELNLRGLRLLRSGGTLVTCSCSHHIALEDFTAVVAAAAADAGRRVQLLETRGAAPDHPEVLTLPETRYLKCLVLRVE